MIMIKSTNSPNSIDGSPFDDFGFNYLWRLHGLGKYMPAFRGMTIVKNGFAKYCRAGGFNGVESRILRLCEASKNLSTFHVEQCEAR